MFLLGCEFVKGDGVTGAFQNPDVTADQRDGIGERQRQLDATRPRHHRFLTRCFWEFREPQRH